MMRKASILLAGAAMGALATVAVTQPRAILGMSSAAAAASDTYRHINLFGDIFERVRTDYVEKPDDGKLIEAAINGMLTSLDPHSSFLDARNFRDMQVQTRGEFGGLGIEVTQEDGMIKVVSPIDDTPASKAGILANDIITHIDNEPIQGLTLQQAVEKMRGPVGSKIVIRVTRAGAQPRDIEITRDRIVIRAVRHQIIGDDIGYIRLTQFNEQTTEALRKAIEDIKAKVPADKLRGYVIDLRNNPGGLLDQSISVSDTFLERGEIVSTRGRNAEETQRWNARAGDMTGGKPVIVLINGGSASASEIVAGALQDHRRATVLGTRSFGKGSVQTIIPLGSQGALRLTTARYYTPSGRSIQARGIDPDIVLEQPVPEELRARLQENRGEAGLRGHLRNNTQEGNEERSASAVYVPREQKDDVQLTRALDLLRGTATDPSFPPSQRAAQAPAQAPAATPATPGAQPPSAPATPAPAPATPSR